MSGESGGGLPNGSDAGGDVAADGEGGDDGDGPRGNLIVAAASGMFGAVEAGGGMVPAAVSGSSSPWVVRGLGAHGGTAGSSGCGGVSGG
jgi:hypothetical protein